MCKNEFKIQKDIELRASLHDVWQALVTPERIRQYLLGATVETTWKVGAPIRYYGNFNGISFNDCGIIDRLEEYKLFRYSYWSANHGTTNSPENYVTISYQLSEIPNGVKLEVFQTNYQSEVLANGMNTFWDIILKKLKTYVEAG